MRACTGTRDEPRTNRKAPWRTAVSCKCIDNPRRPSETTYRQQTVSIRVHQIDNDSHQSGPYFMPCSRASHAGLCAVCMYRILIVPFVLTMSGTRCARNAKRGKDLGRRWTIS